MASASSPTTFSDIHPLILQTQIFPRLDGQSLSSAATTSSYLRTVTADDILWSNICRSIWPSTTHPLVQQLISTFPAGHRSFFQDSFQPPITDVIKQPDRHLPTTNYPSPSELISAVDIRCSDNIIYSRVVVTDTTSDFLSSAPLKIMLNDDDPGSVTGMPIYTSIHDFENADADDATIRHLKESITLNWILIHPTRKRAVNLSSIKPVLAWKTIDRIHLRYAVVLPGVGLNDTVECRIELSLGVAKGGVALHVREVVLNVQDISCKYLSGKDFLVITSKMFSEKYSIRRAPVDQVEREAGSDQTRWANNDEAMSGYFRMFSLFLCFCFLYVLL